MTTQAVDLNYPLLRIYAYYRLGLGGLLLTMFVAGVTPATLGVQDPSLFFYTALTYAAACLLTLLILWQREFSPREEQLFLVLFVDVVALTLLIYASGGLGSGLGFLQLVVVAAGGIFLSRQVSTALTAMASLAVLTQTLYLDRLSLESSREIFVAGILGAMLFACSLSFGYLSRRLRLSAEELSRQAAHAQRIQQMAQSIIERMQTGIVVAKPDGRIELINQSAERLLNWPPAPQRHLDDIREVAELASGWRSHPETRAPDLKVGPTQSEVRLRFAELSTDHDQDTLIFVEDTRGLNREAQNIKLASLGRLTASIAHEIRNPLGAISHAGQLLAESPDLNRADQRLVEIVGTNARRVNQIIENVMQLSRRRPTQTELVQLPAWLEQFRQDYQQQCDVDIPIHNHSGDPDLKVRVDTSHLRQVLTNLTDNGVRHSQQACGSAKVSYEFGIDKDSRLPYLQVIDTGHGIPEESLTHIFEPFFTTEASGSGLGLYLSRELCEANHASLSYERRPDNRSCFRIDFAHPDRIF